MKNIYRGLGLVILVALIVGGFVWSHKKDKGSVSGTQLTNVSVGFQASPPMAALFVAKDKGFFEQQGLNVELKEFSAGKLAFQALLANSLDFSISADVPPFLALLQGNKFIIPAQMIKQTKEEIRVIARKDGEQNNPFDYFHAKKRKLGTSIGGGPEFFTYQFLNKINYLAAS